MCLKHGNRICPKKCRKGWRKICLKIGGVGDIKRFAFAPLVYYANTRTMSFVNNTAVIFKVENPHICLNFVTSLIYSLLAVYVNTFKYCQIKKIKNGSNWTNLQVLIQIRHFLPIFIKKFRVNTLLTEIEKCTRIPSCC